MKIETLKECGIYCIMNTTNKKCYIGSSKNVWQRLQCHRSNLRKNKHLNKHLQNAWNKDTENSFDCFILEYCDFECLEKREQCWLSLIGYYNITKIVERNIPSKESCLKMSISKKKLYSSGKLYISGNPINQYDLNGIFIKRWERIIDATRELHIHQSTIIRNLKKTCKQARGFIFRYIDDCEEVLPTQKHNKNHAYWQNKPVLITILDTKEKLIFESRISAANYLNIPKDILQQVLRKSKTGIYKKKFLIQDLIKSRELLETPEEDNQQPRLIEI